LQKYIPLHGASSGIG